VPDLRQQSARDTEWSGLNRLGHAVVDRKRKSRSGDREPFEGERVGPTGGGGAHRHEASSEIESASPDTAFDRWLERGLKDLYQPVLDEPVPDDLVELIKKHRKQVT
jgi:hypothetical protein